MKHRHMIQFNILSARAGGMGTRAAIEMLKGVGIKAFPLNSIIVDHYAVGIKSHNKRTISRVGRLLYT
jgi:hypothetical protein